MYSMGPRNPWPREGLARLCPRGGGWSGSSLHRPSAPSPAPSSLLQLHSGGIHGNISSGPLGGGSTSMMELAMVDTHASHLPRAGLAALMFGACSAASGCPCGPGVWNLGVGAWGVSVNGMGLRTEGEPLLPGSSTLEKSYSSRVSGGRASNPALQILQPLSVPPALEEMSVWGLYWGWWWWAQGLGAVKEVSTRPNLHFLPRRGFRGEGDEEPWDLPFSPVP